MIFQNSVSATRSMCTTGYVNLKSIIRCRVLKPISKDVGYTTVLPSCSRSPKTPLYPNNLTFHRFTRCHVSLPHSMLSSPTGSPRPNKISDKCGDRRPYCHKRISSHPSWHHSEPVGPDFGRDVEANSSIRRFIVRTCRYQFGGMLLVAYSAIALYSPVSCTCTTQCRRGTARRHRGRLQIPVSALPEKSTQGWGSPRTCGSRRR